MLQKGAILGGSRVPSPGRPGKHPPGTPKRDPPGSQAPPLAPGPCSTPVLHLHLPWNLVFSRLCASGFTSALRFGGCKVPLFATPPEENAPFGLSEPPLSRNPPLLEHSRAPAREKTLFLRSLSSKTPLRATPLAKSAPRPSPSSAAKTISIFQKMQNPRQGPWKTPSRASKTQGLFWTSHDALLRKNAESSRGVAPNACSSREAASAFDKFTSCSSPEKRRILERGRSKCVVQQTMCKRYRYHYIMLI